MTRKSLKLISCIVISLSFWTTAFAQRCTLEQEPNDTPPEASSFTGLGCVVGDMAASDQDSYRLTLTEDDLRNRRVVLTVTGIPEQLTRVDLLKLTFTEDGTGVAGREDLFAFGTSTGERTSSEPLLLSEGTYYLGVSKSGGEGRYELELALAEPSLPGNQDYEPNDSTEDAREQVGAFGLQGDLQGSVDYHRWTLGEEAASYLWRVDAQAQVGRDLTLKLYSSAGEEVLNLSNEDGGIERTNLSLEPDTYTFVLSPATEEGARYVLQTSAQGVRTEGTEREPNERENQASNFDPLEGVSGTLQQGERDVFYFALEEAGFYSLEHGLGDEAGLSLETGGETLLAFRDRVPNLEDLYLEPGAYYLELAGAQQDLDYRLQLVPGEAPAAGFEVEPNNLASYATPLGDALQVRGEMRGRDFDFFSFTVPSPQRFRIQVLAENLNDITVYDGGGTAVYSLAADDRRTRIDNLVLLPGEHIIELDGADSEYALRVLSLGEADLEPQAASGAADGAETDTSDTETPGEAARDDITVVIPPPPGVLEREPNDDETRAEPLRVGETRVGTLGTTRDYDLYRFSLQNDQYVRLTAIPPEDGEVFFDLSGYGRTVMRPDTSAAQSDLWLMAGDYYLTLRAATPSDGYYRLSLEHLDSVDLPVDLEPNNQPYQATPVSVPSVLKGYLGEQEDDDWFALPVFDTDQTLTVTVDEDKNDEGPREGDRLGGVSLFDLSADARLPDETADDRKGFTFVVPAGTPTALRLRGHGTYRLTLALGGASSAEKTEAEAAEPEAADSPVSLELSFDSTDVAAYWHQAQALTGTLQLANDGTNAEEVDLLWHSTDAAVQIRELPERIRLEPGSEERFPVTLLFAADLRDDTPITLSVGAKGNGSTASTRVALAPVCEVPPVRGRPHWSVPDTLLGQWNVLAHAFGADVVERGEASARDRELLDGRASPATGALHTQGEVVYFDLAGDDPVTLTGALLHPLARQESGRQLAEFEILASLDDETFETVYRGRLSAVRQEQAFIFAEPVRARFVGIRFVSRQDGRPNDDANLGEFKLLSPDSPLARVNLADPRLGGQVVWSRPLMGGGHPILSETPEGEGGDNPSVRLEPEQTALSWVVGFHHNRAARIAALEWVDSLRSSEEERIERVDVAVSLESPTGPWTPLTTWALERSPAEDANGVPEVTPLQLEAPAWARYIRFEATGLEPRSTHDLPETLRVFEHQADDYRSILTEWGFYSRDAVYEWQHPPTASPDVVEQDDNNSRERATPLVLGTPLSDTVAIAEDEDWYVVTVPEGQNVLELSLTGSPSIEYSFRLEDTEGRAVSYTTAEETASRVVLQAEVVPGDYYLEIEEPPRSVAFVWDNSGSMGPYRNTVYGALERFSQDIQVGREEVALAVFGNDAPYYLMPRMTGSSFEVLRALGTYDRRHDSSNAEPSLLGVTDMLGARSGTRAVLFITDAESGGYNLTDALWQSLGEVKPRVFTFEISSGGNAGPQDLMQAWADAGRGRYQAVAGTGDLDVGFARASCLLRRPKTYTLSARALAVERGPGRLRVVREAGEASGESREEISGAIEVILDASGSMYKRLDERFRYQIAVDVLSDLVGETLPAGTPFALRVFGNREAESCRTDLEVPLGPLDAAVVNATIAGIEPQPFSGTPIAASLEQVGTDLTGVTGPRTVILITDGEESCGGDVERAISTLRGAGVDVVLNVIGFDFDASDREAARETFERWAELGGGRYYDANSAEALAASLEQAATVLPYEVLDAENNLVAQGVVDDEGVALPAGRYTVRLLNGARDAFEVQVQAEGNSQVRVPNP